MVLGASSRGLEAIWKAFGRCLGDLGTSQRGKKGAQVQLESKTLIFHKSCSRVGASMVFRGRSVLGGTKKPSNIILGGVGECMEGQIGGKSGPGVLRTRQSGDLGAWGEAWEGPGEGPKLLLRRSPVSSGDFPATASRVSSKQGNKELLSHSLMTP